MTNDKPEDPETQPTKQEDERGQQKPPQEIVEAAKQLRPEEQTEVVTGIMTSIAMSGTIPDPIRAKINEEHIAAAIEMADKHDGRQYDIARQRENRKDSNRWFAITVFILVLGAVGGLCWLFKDDSDTLQKILALILGFGAGAIGGFGYGKSQSE